MLQNSHNQRPAVAGYYAATVVAQTDIFTVVMGKARSSNLLQCHSVLTFRRECLSGQAACGRHPTNGKEAGSVGAVDLSFGFSVTSLRG